MYFPPLSQSLNTYIYDTLVNSFFHMTWRLNLYRKYVILHILKLLSLCGIFLWALLNSSNIITTYWKTSGPGCIAHRSLCSKIVKPSLKTSDIGPWTSIYCCVSPSRQSKSRYPTILRISFALLYQPTRHKYDGLAFAVIYLFYCIIFLIFFL